MSLMRTRTSLYAASWATPPPMTPAPRFRANPPGAARPDRARRDPCERLPEMEDVKQALADRAHDQLTSRLRFARQGLAIPSPYRPADHVEDPERSRVVTAGLGHDPLACLTEDDRPTGRRVVQQPGGRARTFATLQTGVPAIRSVTKACAHRFEAKRLGREHSVEKAALPGPTAVQLLARE